MKRRLRGDRGATAVEFALCFPILLTVLLMTIYGGLYVFYGAIADHVARKIARDVAIPMSRTGSPYPDQVGQALVEERAKNATEGLIPDPSSVTVTSSRLAVAPGDEVTVTVSYEGGALRAISDVLWFLPSPSDGVTRSASARRE